VSPFFDLDLRKKKISAAMMAIPATPPTTPPAMAPTGVEDPDDAGTGVGLPEPDVAEAGTVAPAPSLPLVVVGWSELELVVWAFTVDDVVFATVLEVVSETVAVEKTRFPL
jgi:hypothetical protein